MQIVKSDRSWSEFIPYDGILKTKPKPKHEHEGYTTGAVDMYFKKLAGVVEDNSLQDER
jgi:hypothetical protein